MKTVSFVIELLFYVTMQVFSLFVVSVFFMKTALANQTPAGVFLLSIPFVLMVTFVSSHYCVEVFLDVVKNTKFAKKVRQKVVLQEIARQSF